MNTKFLVGGRWYKTPCKTVLNAESFTVEFFTAQHTILANVPKKKYFLSRDNKTLTKLTNKIYFNSIDGISLFPLKRDFLFSGEYTNPQNFLTHLYKTLDSFLNTSIPFAERHFPHSTDDLIGRILEKLQMKEDTTEKELEETATDTETTEAETATEELSPPELFERLTKTLYKSLFKAIGIEDTRKIHFTFANDIVFFNYKGTQYKYYPSQCKIFKKCDRKYQRINWKDFAEENNPDGQNQKRGRSPPFTPDIRSINIDKFKIKE